METLSAPVTAHNLTGWFILARSPAPDHNYSVLEEAIDSQTTLLHETGDVNELLIENTGDVDLFIQAGDIVKGGKQDRTIGTDFVVPARSGKIPLPVYCVEQSRWQRRSSEPVTHFSASKDFVSSKKARLALQLLKNQGEVWKSVAEEQQSLAFALADEVRSDESPTSLQLTYENEVVRHAVADYTTLLEGAPAAAGGRVVGVVWAINDVPSHADRYVHPTLFAKLWRKLLRAAAIEALGQSRRRTPAGETAGATEPPTTDAIREWLAARELLESSRLDEERLAPRTRVRTHRGRSQHRFEVFDTALDAATPLHVTVIAE
ncbi:MAG: DUF6569 family protein [Planctomycetia bacterium]|nr:hypothetical protein [Planctomycetia bacterium]